MKKIVVLLFFIAIFPFNVFAEKLNISDVQKILLNENPKLKSIFLETEMAKKMIPVSSSLEDPKLKIGINSLPVNTWSFKDEDMTSKEIGISQMIPLGGKLSTKESMAIKDYYKSLENYRNEKALMLHMLRVNIYELAYIRNSLKIYEEMENYLRMLVDSQTALAKSGLGNLANVVKANIELTMLEEEIITFKQKEISTLKQISYLVGRDIDIDTDKIFENKLLEISKNEIKEKILSLNPELKALLFEKEKSELEVALKKKEYYPDLELSISYMQRDNSPAGMKRPDMISAMASVNIPIWSGMKNVPMIEEREKKKSMVDRLIEDKKNELINKVDTIISNLERWKSLYNLYEENLIPLNEIALESFISRFKSGNMEFMPLVDTVRMLLKYKKEVIMMKKEYLSGVSELYSLMGDDSIR